MTPEQNVETMRRLMLEGFGRGDLAVVDQVMSPDHAEHQAGMGTGREAVKQHIQRVRAGFPDLAIGIEDLVAAGDRVVLRHCTSGTHRGPSWATHRPGGG
jgi:predicted ester cyclase